MFACFHSISCFLYLCLLFSPFFLLKVLSLWKSLGGECFQNGVSVGVCGQIIVCSRSLKPHLQSCILCSLQRFCHVLQESAYSNALHCSCGCRDFRRAKLVSSSLNSEDYCSIYLVSKGVFFSNHCQMKSSSQPVLSTYISNALEHQ